ncbi:GIY-YIG nuclease family protein [Niameybacter massiliensis]|uniref:GIY-YIG nuclease family protein n=1 Tax=Holtiella tumoricola TaxID=3018743 RepID=A0AA42DNJ8_9FIRM|nr:GIY-YIG nuclease family protein [Holtiella tumoricola]MDA3732120.1 GIY-YIG nuclease family protein [Holtiella tumoricola]
MTTIYKIYDLETDEVLYVGSTCKEPLIRFGQHQKDLSNGTHKNKKLQNEYESRNAIGYDVVMRCEETLINRYVLEYIVTSVLRPICNKVFNMSRTKCAYNMRLIDKDLARKLLEVISNVNV